MLRKTWEKGRVYDIVNISEFGRNYIKKCVEVDGNDIWKVYVEVSVCLHLCFKF